MSEKQEPTPEVAGSPASGYGEAHPRSEADAEAAAQEVEEIEKKPGEPS